jgi:hypothetical protein
MWASKKLVVEPDARLLAHKLFEEVCAPQWYRAVTARLLPPAARAAFAMPYRGADARHAEAASSRGAGALCAPVKKQRRAPDLPNPFAQSPVDWADANGCG